MTRVRRFVSRNLSWITRVRRIFGTNRFLASMIFRQDFFGSLAFHTYFDAGTIVMRRALLRHVRDRMKVCEIGTGAYAVLLVYLARRFRDLGLLGLDINPICAELARVSVYINRVPIRIVEGDFEDYFLSNPDEIHSYDLIFANAPYIPPDLLAACNLPHLKLYEDLYRGSCHIAFLDKVARVLRKTGYQGRVAISTNDMYLSKRDLVRVLAEASFEPIDEIAYQLPVVKNVQVVIFGPAGGARLRS